MVNVIKHGQANYRWHYNNLLCGTRQNFIEKFRTSACSSQMQINAKSYMCTLAILVFHCCWVWYKWNKFFVNFSLVSKVIMKHGLFLKCVPFLYKLKNVQSYEFYESLEKTHCESTYCTMIGWIYES